MGDRGNIVVQKWVDGIPERVCLYAHWGGRTLPMVLSKALAKKWRWQDATYLARIIFDVMTEGRHGEEDSFGISASPMKGNFYPNLVVDVNVQRGGEQRVWTEDESGMTAGRGGYWSFEEFIQLAKDGWEGLGVS